MKAEHYPVASHYIKDPDQRYFIQALYAFCRRADDLADHPHRPAEDKIAQLNLMLGSFLSPETMQTPDQEAIHLRHLFDAQHVSAKHMETLFQGWQRDTAPRPIQNWSDLYLACQYSAAPIGLIFRELFNESDELNDFFTSLAIAIQLVNHLRDCGKDYKETSHSYVPQQWLKAQNLSSEVLGQNSEPRSFKGVKKQFAEKINDIFMTCPAHLKTIQTDELRREVKLGLNINKILLKKLLKKDVLKTKISLNKWDMFIALLRS